MYHHSEFRQGKSGVDVMFESCDLAGGTWVYSAGVNSSSSHWVYRKFSHYCLCNFENIEVTEAPHQC